MPAWISFFIIAKTARFDEAISEVCYYFMRLPRSLRLLAMTI
ncbi:hypothetical protein RAMDARK_0597 [Rickettsia amblyommatis str. Darkwater]|uniref:Uncharacterized protein n=1 Tax=Rickettsia amblyommatis str. Ac/Pa TaxID=1359164 RepID=A0A0F3N2C3_RICAM|nr:hypothetical protein APHACPA_0863 [Rickettsia amblyommatis str. Ac/Pa]KJV96815.1 hypothetical protein RAMDARK_0597 [Rickettsia amblyommatis str. Darkwater]